jgi:hypothetical protein
MHRALLLGGLLRRASEAEIAYHHSISRLEVTLALLFGLGVRSRRTGHGASLMTFSAIEPNTVGYQPETPWVEMTTRSILSVSIASRIVPATS